MATATALRQAAHAPVRTIRRRDTIVAAVAFGLTIGLLGTNHGAGRALDPLGGALAAAACWPLLAHRRGPLTVFAVTTLSSAALNALGYALGPPFGPTVALFYLARDRRTHERLREVGLAVLALFAIHVGATSVGNGAFPTVPILAGITVWGGAWIIGDQVRQRRQRQRELRERAARVAHDAERERRLATAEERTRIARDLHDSAGHAINVILVQAGAARLLQDRDPQAVHDALQTIEDVARETIGEIDQLICGLRENASAAVEPADLSGVQTLARRHRAAGLDVRVSVDGQARPLAPGLGHAVYRIVQESLTNAARYGDGHAELELAYGVGGIELTVSNRVAPAANPTATDDGRLGSAPGDGGHGILGMRERAALLGGSLDAEPCSDSFRVHARLPYPAGAPA